MSARAHRHLATVAARQRTENRRSMRPVAVSPLVACLALAASPALATAQAPETVLATMTRATVVGAAGGWTAWSEPQDGRYVLVTRAPDGTVSRPAITPRGVPFDIDLGTNAQGRVVAAYSRCVAEPRPTGGANATGPQWTSGQGCSLHILDLAAGTERALKRRAANASEVLPSVSGRTIAYVAVRKARKQRGKAFLLVRGTDRDTVLDSGPRRAASPGFAEGPTSIDTDGVRVTSAWRYADREFNSFESDLRVQRIGGKPKSVAGASNNDICNYETVLAPTLTGATVTFLDTTGSDWAAVRTPVARQSARYGVTETGSDPSTIPTSAAVDGRRMVIAGTVGDLTNINGTTLVRELTLGAFSSKPTISCA